MISKAIRYLTDGYFWPVLLVPFLLIGCEDPGNVGSSFTDTDTKVEVDTFSVSGIETESTNAFTGNLDHLPIGMFQDPLFGDLAVTGLIRPTLSNDPDDFMDNDAIVRIRLLFDQEQVFGDSAASASFDIIELDQVWRGRAWRIDDNVTLSSDPPVASFTVGKEDAIDVELADSWVDKYRNFYNSDAETRDSVYLRDFPGLAIVPQNQSKVIPVVMDTTRFIIINPGVDTLRQDALDWAYSLDRSNVPAPPAGTNILHNTLEQVLKFDLSLNRDKLGTVNISRAELVFFQNSSVMENSLDQVSATAARPLNNNSLVYVEDPADLPLAVDPGIDVGRATLRKRDNSFRYNITDFVNSVINGSIPPNERFIIKLSTNNGFIKSSLFFNGNAPEAQKPKLIITSVETNSGSN